MNTTKKSLWAMTCLMCAALLLSTTFVACGESSSGDDTKDPTKPEVPINPDDYMTVPATGGTIEKGDITIEFPSGTFASDTKVAVTEVGKGNILGADEASAFYQVTMPVSTKQSVTVKLKCDKQENDIYVVTQVPTIGKHLLDVVTYMPVSCETTYKNGEYIATLPASQNTGASEEISISIGLGHRAVFCNSASLNGARTATRAIEGETEGNISWYFDTSRAFEAQYATQLATSVDRINSFIHEAIKKIDKLGFKLLIPKRRIPITLFKKTKETSELWGQFNQHYSNDTKSWFAIREDMLTDLNANQKDVKATIFHELLHYFQADYDQRIPFQKYRDCKGDDLLMYEAGGMWIEKFVYGYVPITNNRMKYFIKGLNDIEATYAEAEDLPNLGKGKFDMGYARQSHGYAMGSLWEYLAQELGDNKIICIYDEWANNVQGLGFKNQSTFETLKKFARNQGSYLFSGGYESFVHQCATGDIIPGFGIGNFEDELKRLTKDETSLEFEGISYGYGADVKRLWIAWNSAESLEGKEIVIKQETDNMDTYLYNNDDPSKLIREKSITTKDSLVISGAELEKTRNQDGIKAIYYMLSMHSISPEKPKPYKIKVYLKDAEKKPAKGKYNLSLAQLVVSIKCNVTEIGSNGKEYEMSLLGGFSMFNYVGSEGLDMMEDETGIHVSNHYEYTDRWGIARSLDLSFDIGNLDGFEGGSTTVSNLKATEKVTNTNTVETYQLSVSGAIPMSGKIDDYHNGAYSAAFELRGDQVNAAEVKYTNYLKGSLWQKDARIVSDPENSINVSLMVWKQEE